MKHGFPNLKLLKKVCHSFFPGIVALEWKRKYDLLAEEMQSCQTSQRQAESQFEMLKNKSFQRESAQKS